MDENKRSFLKEKGEQQKEARIRKAQQIAGLVEPFLQDIQVKRVLSIGAGFCFLDEWLHKALFPSAEFISTDINEERLFCFEHSSLKKRVLSAAELDYAPESFDFILAHQVLEHMNDYAEALQKIGSMCRKGGVVYINVPNPLSPMIGKTPAGKWPRPLLSSFFDHIARKFKSDFISNTEKYHTGFTQKVLSRYLTDYNVTDVRKARLKQELPGSFMRFCIDVLPSWGLFLVVESNIWICTRRK